MYQWYANRAATRGNVDWQDLYRAFIKAEIPNYIYGSSEYISVEMRLVDMDFDDVPELILCPKWHGASFPTLDVSIYSIKNNEVVALDTGTATFGEDAGELALYQDSSTGELFFQLSDSYGDYSWYSGRFADEIRNINSPVTNNTQQQEDWEINWNTINSVQFKITDSGISPEEVYYFEHVNSGVDREHELAHFAIFQGEVMPYESAKIAQDQYYADLEKYHFALLVVEVYNPEYGPDTMDANDFMLSRFK